MNQQRDDEMNEVRDALAVLRDVRAPASVYEEVMMRTDLADSYFAIDTPLGRMFVAYNNHGISAVKGARDEAAFEQEFFEEFGRHAYQTDEPPATLRRAVVDTLEGRRRDLRFDLRGLSEFEQAVLLKAFEIPRGEIRPYSWIASEIGRPRAMRAVGTALANNPIPLLIPCHRVVRRDGIIGNYGLGGTDNKKAILRWEGLDPDEIEVLARQGVRYVGSNTTSVYCFPSCRHARRIAPQHRHPFHSEVEAEMAGFRPCKVCRPFSAALGA